jgi:alkyldihydroxyacetonephosphate synthase
MADERARHPWGWGWADKFPDDAARDGLGKLAALLLGAPPEPPPPAAEATLPAPRIAPPAALAPIVDAAPAARAARALGKGYPDLVRGRRGERDAAPDLVARPRDEADVVALLDWCSGERLAAVPFGGGTSVVGGIECPRDAARGVVTIDLGGLDRVHEIEPLSRTARIGAGARGPVLDAQLAERDLTLRHYPQSYEFSTLGGWLATRAGGHYATVYTHIDELCAAMRVVTPRGVIETRRLPASGAGPAPDRMFLGSEGTLGIITEAWMRVVPRPKHRAIATVKFARFADAVTATRRIAQSGLHPTNCRLLDPTEAMLHRVSMDGTAVLLLGFESADHPLGAWIARAVEIAQEAGGKVASGPSESSATGEAGSWKQAFFDAPYLQTALVSIGVLADTFETACPWDRFDALHAAVTGAALDALRRECGGGRVACRFTHVYPDGPAPYYTFLGRARPGAELAQWRAIKAAASEALAAHGGTITHHHAVGRVHRPWYDRERPALFAEALAAVKRALDPAGVMNPGVVIDVDRS